MTKFYARAVFFVRDASRSLEFYTRELGFSLDWTYEEGGKPHVFQVSLHGFELISSSTLRAGTTTKVHWGAPTIAIHDPDQNEVFFWLAEGAPAAP